MKNIVASLTLQPKKRSELLPPPPISQPILPSDPLAGIPGADVLRSTPGIEPFLLPGLIPDLLYLAETGQLSEAISRARPNDPTSIIFNHPSQIFHEETKKVEMDILTGNIDLTESDIECINPRCRAKSVVGPKIEQRRRADEPPTGKFRCTKCRREWAISMA